jgi:hypothetical protein
VKTYSVKEIAEMLNTNPETVDGSVTKSSMRPLNQKKVDISSMRQRFMSS